MIKSGKMKEEKQEKRIALDLGCGQNKATVQSIKEGANVEVDEVIGVDFVKEEGIDIVHNLTSFPYPFEDKSVDFITTSHFLEHLDGFERALFMEECYRILKDGGKMRHIHPYWTSSRAVQDFTHKWPPITEASYCYWNKAWREMNKLTHGHYNLKCNFDFVPLYSWQDQSWVTKHEEARNFAVLHNTNVIADLVVDMVKLPENVIAAEGNSEDLKKSIEELSKRLEEMKKSISKTGAKK